MARSKALYLQHAEAMNSKQFVKRTKGTDASVKTYVFKKRLRNGSGQARFDEVESSAHKLIPQKKKLHPNRS